MSINKVMKRLMLIAGLLLTLTACKKSNVAPYSSQGTITGYDHGECPMCGGLEITIKNDTTKNPLSFYRIDKTLTQLGISESTKFPINVSLNWQRETEPTGTTYITVSQIKVLK